MSEFQRSPSKVWWANDTNNYESPNCQRFHNSHIFSPQASLPYSINEEDHEGVTSFNEEEEHATELETNQTIIINSSQITKSSSSSSSTSSSSSASDWSNRNISSSPNSHKSQDSGFSDSEMLHNLESNNSNKSDPIMEQLEKNLTPETPEKNINFNREKYSPKKSISAELNNLNELRKNVRSLPSTPELERNKRNVNMIGKELQRYNIESIIITPNLNQNNNFINTISFNTANKINFHRNISHQRNAFSEIKPSRKHKFSTSKPLKVNRNLFSCVPSSHKKDSAEDFSELPDCEPMASHFLSESFPKYNPPKIYYHDPRSNRKQFNVTAPVANQLHYDSREISFEEVTNSCLSQIDHSSIVNDSSLNQALIASADRTCELPMQPLDHLEPPIFQSTPKTFQPSTDIRLYKQTITNNLEKNIKSENNEVQIRPVVQSESKPRSVEQWMNELAKLYEAECMITLQSKSLATHLSRQVAQAATNATFTIKALLAHSKIICSDFQLISRYLAEKDPSQVSSLLMSLHGNMVEFILTYIINSQSKIVDRREMEVHEMLDICDKLKRKYTDDTEQIDFSHYHFEEIGMQISRLKSLFRETEKNILMMQIQLLINMIEEPSTELALRGAIHGVMWAASSTSTNELLVKCGAIRALLITCVENKASTIRAAALRTLAVSCSTSKAIQQFEEVGGIEIIADILCEITRPEPELFEAVAVLVQITAPWIDNNEKLRGLKRYAQTLIQSLTRLAQLTKCCQNLLLCAAALANISTMEPTTVWPLLQSHTAECLLSAVQKRGPFASVFLKEQTATLIANMAAAPESRVQLGEGKAAVALLCFLQVRPSVLDDPKSSNEYAACLRLQQKSAVALSRLCNEKMVAEQVVALGGVGQIVRLCKEKRERNHSDAILVAALGALRKIASICGNEIMEEQDVTELIEPRLLDSFLTYSAQNESYV